MAPIPFQALAVATVVQGTDFPSNDYDYWVLSLVDFAYKPLDWQY